jgi:hypothetical protein
MNHIGEFILSAVIAISTVFYTCINWKMFRESKRQREDKITPLIVAYLKSTEDHMMLRLYIKNIGDGLAKNVIINILQDYNQFGLTNKKLSDIGAIRNGLNIFPPKEEYAYFIDSWRNIGKSENIKKMCIEMSIDYERIDGKKYNSQYNLPLIQVASKDYATPPETYVGKIAYYLEEIHKLFKNNQTSDNTHLG